MTDHCPICYRSSGHKLDCQNQRYEAALREKIAADIQERLVPADRTEVAEWIRNRAARIAEKGNHNE